MASDFNRFTPIVRQAGGQVAPAETGGGILVDALTGLATRHHFVRCVEQRLADTRCPHPGLILLDIDRFKPLNDAVGCATGDKLLCHVAARIAAKAPQGALLARISGHGFAILLKDCGDAAQTAAELRDYLGRPYALDGAIMTVTVSIGVAMVTEADTTRDDLFHAAELALHQAQAEQGNCARTFDPAMRTRATERRVLESELRCAIAAQEIAYVRALDRQQFAVHYQPKVKLATGRVTGFEALLRWHHPTRGLIKPDRFIPLAEETGLISRLGEWVLGAACRDAARWPVTADGQAMGVAVNISPVQLRDGDALVAAIAGALGASGLAADRLELELTETALADDVGNTLAAIRALGVGLTLDDFGAGHSSLGRLHHYPFTRLKIDRMFVVALDRADDREAARAAEWMLRAIALMGLGLGLDTVVEGIETERQRDIAARAGCVEMQGYLASPAVADSAVAAMIRRGDLLPPQRTHGDGR